MEHVVNKPRGLEVIAVPRRLRWHEEVRQTSADQQSDTSCSACSACSAHMRSLLTNTPNEF